MKILGLDISTNTGYAALEDDMVLSFGNITSEKDKISDYGEYPLSYLLAAEDVANKIAKKIEEINPDIIVIEETNKQSRFSSRYSTKILEFIHCILLCSIKNKTQKTVYLSTGDWRRAVNIRLTKEQKKLNAKMAKAKKKNKGATLNDASGKKIKGKITNKHLAVMFVNAKFGLNFKQKDNDIAEAICLVEAYKNGCKHCDGIF